LFPEYGKIGRSQEGISGLILGLARKCSLERYTTKIEGEHPLQV